MKELFPPERAELIGFHPELVAALEALEDGKVDETREILHQFLKRTLQRLREATPLALALRRDLKPMLRELRKLIELTKGTISDEDVDSLREVVVRASKISDDIGSLLLRVKEALDRKSAHGENPHIYIFYLYTLSVLRDLQRGGRRHERYLEVTINSLNAVHEAIVRYVPVLRGFSELSEKGELPEETSELLRDLQLSFLGMRESLGKAIAFLDKLITESEGSSEDERTLADELKELYSELKERWLLFTAAAEDLDKFTRRLLPLNFLLTRILWLFYKYNLGEETRKQLLETLSATLDKLREDVRSYREVVVTPLAEAELRKVEEALELSEEILTQLTEMSLRPSEALELVVELDEVLIHALSAVESVREHEDRAMSWLPPTLRALLKLVQRSLERTVPESLMTQLMLILRQHLLSLFTLMEAARLFLRTSCEELRAELIEVMRAYANLQRADVNSWRSNLWELVRSLVSLESVEAKECLEAIKLQEEGLRIKCPRCSALNPVSKEFCESCSLDLMSVGGDMVRGGTPEELVRVGFMIEGYMRGEVPEELLLPALGEISEGLKRMAETDRRYVPILEAWSALLDSLDNSYVRDQWRNLVNRYLEVTS